MKIVFLPEFDEPPAPAGGPRSDAAPEPDRVAGPAYVVEVPAVPPPAPADRFSDTEWSAFMDLS